MAEASPRRGIQSIEIGYRLLQVLEQAPRALPLREIALGAGLSPSAANNYLVSLVRTGLAAADDKAGHYRLGPAAIGLGMSAIRQMDGFDVVRREVVALRDTTRHSAAVTAWTAEGPMSLFKQEGDLRSALELRTGLLSMTTTAAGKVFAASLPQATTLPLIARDPRGAMSPARIAEAAREELARAGYVVVRPDNGTGYASAAAPIPDWSGAVRFVLSVIGSQATLMTEPGSPAIIALLAGAARATAALGGKPAKV
ncbi:MAG: helix-turn-helix domain-containing protein [Roseococcus sp.]